MEIGEGETKTKTEVDGEQEPGGEDREGEGMEEGVGDF